MRQAFTSGHRRALAGALVALCVLLVPATLASASSPAPSATGDPAPTSITCVLALAAVGYGDHVAVSGQVLPAAAQTITLTLDGVAIGTAEADASGAYAFDLVAHGGGQVAAVAADGTASAAALLVVRPKLSVGHGAAVPFLSTRFVVSVTPSAYAGVVTLRVMHRGALVATVKGRVAGGKLTLSVPLRGIGAFDLTVQRGRVRQPQHARAGRARRRQVGPGGRGHQGSDGPRPAHRALPASRCACPSSAPRSPRSCGDALVAFQKAYRLPRTRVADGDDWRRLDVAKVIKPRFASPSVHVEVDKTRQILMVVRNGAVYGYIAVSTGATGNTPEGSFRIQRKSPATSTFYGSGTLTWVMGFIGNFAIHGYPLVPAYPASHGCIREPLWVAHWTYTQSFVGERLYVYR